MSFKFGLARARGQQHCPQHREHLLSSRRNSDGPRFNIWHKGSSEFLFRVSGRHPNVWILSVEALLLRCLTTQTDGLTVTPLHASRMLRTICCSRCAARLRAFGTELTNRARSFLSHCLRANIKPPLLGLCHDGGKNNKLCAPSVCLFLLAALCGVHCVERVAVFCWLSCAASLFRLHSCARCRNVAGTWRRNPNSTKKLIMPLDSPLSATQLSLIPVCFLGAQRHFAVCPSIF